MISREGKKGFFAAHWDWLVAFAGLAALVAGGLWFVTESAVDPDESANEVVASLGRASSATGVTPVDMQDYERALKGFAKPAKVVEIPAKAASFLASERRVFCKCQKAIPAGLKTCPFCNAEQESEKKITLDTDADGLPNEWETKYGLNPNDASDADGDLDGDGFTNAEEFAAKTDPSDAKDHPDYLESLALELPLEQTTLSFFLNDVRTTPRGETYVFRAPKERNDYGQVGVNYSVLKGEEIGKTGFEVVSYEHKTEKIKIKGGTGMEKVRDVSEVTLKRKSDGKTVTARISERNAPVDVQAKLVYTRAGRKEFAVVKGSTIELHGEKYKVTAVEALKKGAKVTVESVLTGKGKTLEALEQ